MQFALSQKVKKPLGVKQVSDSDAENSDLYTWSVSLTNIFEDGESDLLIMMNWASRMAVIVYPVTEEFLEDLTEQEASRFFREQLEQTFVAYGYKRSIIDAYFSKTQADQFVKNNNRSINGQLNQAINFAIGHLEDLVDPWDFGAQPANYSVLIKENLIKIDKNYQSARESMTRALEEEFGPDVVDPAAFELTMTLDLLDYQVMRKMIAPKFMNFKDLHRELQYLFNWNNGHLYEFEIGDKDQKIRLFEKSEFLEELAEEVALAENYQLSDLLEAGSEFTYIYDFGDNWEVNIEVAEADPQYDKGESLVIEVQGQAPLEDSGGPYGFQELRKILNDPEHPEHETAKEWVYPWTAKEIPFAKLEFSPSEFAFRQRFY